MPERRWILFDVGGVLELVDDDAWQDAWWARWREVTGLGQDAFETRIAGADLPAIDVAEGVEDIFWNRLADALGLDDAHRTAMRADFWNAYCGEGNHDLIAYARSLRGRAGVAILSNSADGAREEEERRFGFSGIFDPICYSHEQGVNKPDPLAYLTALQRMGAAPGDVLFVDDRQVSIDGAADVGIRGVLHRDNAVTISEIEEFLAESD